MKYFISISNSDFILSVLVDRNGQLFEASDDESAKKLFKKTFKRTLDIGKEFTPGCRFAFYKNWTKKQISEMPDGWEFVEAKAITNSPDLEIIHEGVKILGY